MKKLKLYAAMAVAVLSVAGTALPAQAAGTGFVKTQINGRTCYVKVIAAPEWCLPENDRPESPEEPETPSEPEIPSEPELPSEPVAPSEPDMPDAPEMPSEPGTPDAPETPDEDTSYAAQVVRLVNEERAKEGLAPLTIDEGLTAAGNVRAQEIVTNFSHTRPDGTSFATAIQEQGVSYRRSGENIAWGQRSPEEVVNAWMNSSGHRANIMNANFTRIGVGHYQNGSGTNYWVQLFAD